MLLYALSNGIMLHSLPILYPPLLDEFGWTTAEVTIPATAFFIFGAITSPPAGILLDKYSPRLIISIGIAGLVAGLVWFSFFTKLWQLVCIYLIFGLSLSLCGLVSNMVVLTRWFDQHRGRATGLLLMASSFGGALFPLVIGASMSHYGWRGALVILAIIMLITSIIALKFLIVDQPKNTDLTASTNSTSAINKNSDHIKKISSGPTFREAIKQPTFYLIAIATGLIWFAVIALVQHQTIYLVKDVKLPQETIPLVMSVFFSCSVVGKLCFGWMSESIDKHYTLIISVAIFIVGLLILGQIGPEQSSLLLFYAAIAGIGFSGAFTTIQLLIAHYYASASYGKILACLVLIDSLAGALGTRIIAQLRDQSGDYFLAIHLMIAACLVAIISIFIIIKIESKTTHENHWREK